MEKRESNGERPNPKLVALAKEKCGLSFEQTLRLGEFELALYEEGITELKFESLFKYIMDGEGDLVALVRAWTKLMQC